jgi:hypothetical protein
LVWIGGWASSVEAWRSRIEAAYPQWSHAFVAVEEVQDLDPEALTEFVISIGGSGAVTVAWSLGSQLALRAWNARVWPESMPLVAVCPVVEFCAEKGPWKPMVLNRMIRALGRDREAVLEDFRKLMWDGMPADLAEAWRNEAAKITDDALVRGLELLRDGVLGTIRAGQGLVLVEASQDRVSPGLAAVLEPGELSLHAVHELATGHVPFLEDVAGFRQILSKLD